MAQRICSECGASLAGLAPTAKTCTANCRSKRSRRLTRLRREASERSAELRTLPEEIRAVDEAARGYGREVGRELLREELRPVVREAITEDTMRSIRDMVALTPKAVARLEQDLDSDDATIRQRAYSLLIKYTVGHPAVVRPDEADAGKQLVVNIGLPRPGAEPTVEAVADELRTCDVCEQEKPVDEFVGDSSRCLACHEERARAVTERFA